MQLAQEYRYVNEEETAIEYCREGLRLAEKEERIHIYEMWMQVHLPVMLSSIGKKEEAVEAGEKLGFLPGDLQNKVDPYLRPLYDALFDMFGAETFAKHMERGTIEVAPLAYMRGRTLDDSFIILDEAQNTTREQIKMFLTRLGFNSKMVITGDITQIDLPDSRKSGLIDAMHILKNIDDISITRFTEKDVVRHKLVQDIIKAYEKAYSDRKG